MKRFARFALAAAALGFGLALGPAAPPAAAQTGAQIIALQAHEIGATRRIALGIGKSVIVELPADVKDVLVANPKIANAIVRSTRRAFLIGSEPGDTTILFSDAEGRQIAAFEISVQRDLGTVRAALRQMLPFADLKVMATGDNVVLTGQVASPVEAQQAFDVAVKFVGDEKKVVNALAIRGRDQVMLKVTVAEMQRDVIKQLGVDLDITSGVTTAVVGPQLATAANLVNGQFPINSDPAHAVRFGAPWGSRNIGATIRAMEQAGIIRTLAEPNLTAISGEPAKFLAGGEFPVYAGRTCTPDSGCQTTVQYKEFGVGLVFTPVVLTEGRISLKVGTEVSELSDVGAIKIDAITLPALKVRRAQTTVELPSGGSLVLAGLIQDQTRQAINGVPGLMKLPVLGTLFKSRDYQRRQTELAIIVTPYIVKPVSREALAKPDDGYADPSDPSSIFLNRLNRVYGVRGKPGQPRPAKNYGFILD